MLVFARSLQGLECSRASDRGEAPSRSYWVDAENGDVLRVKMIGIEGPIRIPVTVDLYDFEETDGLRGATRVEIQNPESGKMVFTFSNTETGLDLADAAFRLEDPEASEQNGE